MQLLGHNSKCAVCGYLTFGVQAAITVGYGFLFILDRFVSWSQLEAIKAC